jgi:winged helix-turn-helix protein
MTASLVLVGDKLGLYRALADAGPATSAGLASRTGTNERMVREWLAAQAASGYVVYDDERGRYSLSPEQAMVFADEESPVLLAGFLDVVGAGIRGEDTVIDAFRTGKGVGWHEQHRCLFRGTERFFRASYRHHLVQEWLPALDGVIAKLEHGGTVADVGCGRGASTIVMATPTRAPGS